MALAAPVGTQLDSGAAAAGQGSTGRRAAMVGWAAAAVVRHQSLDFFPTAATAALAGWW
jgi:hypothetical protein